MQLDSRSETIFEDFKGDPFAVYSCTRLPWWLRLKLLPAMRETQVRSLGWEDPLEKEMATHSSILAWRIPWMEEPGRLQSMGSQRVGHYWATSLSLFTFMLLWYKGRRARRFWAKTKEIERGWDTGVSNGCLVWRTLRKAGEVSMSCILKDFGSHFKGFD